jgi:16S rRNA (guanine527-N7)-methyltransferase
LPPSAAKRLLGLVGRYGVDVGGTDRLAALLAALAVEPSPPTTVSDPREAADVHVADSLSGLEADPIRSARRVADIGAGAGFPGLVLAAVGVGTHVDLVESTRKKCEVIERLAAAADITNASTVPERAEEWAAAGGSEAYDVVTARALAALPVLLEYAAPLLRVDGHLVAWKGAHDPAEARSAVLAAELLGLEAAERIAIRPFKGSRERNLYVYRKVEATPDRFPRRAGMATKRPLA